MTHVLEDFLTSLSQVEVDGTMRYSGRDVALKLGYGGSNTNRATQNNVVAADNMKSGCEFGRARGKEFT
jgi:hypothetical protein